MEESHKLSSKAPCYGMGFARPLSGTIKASETNFGGWGREAPTKGLVARNSGRMVWLSRFQAKGISSYPRWVGTGLNTK